MKFETKCLHAGYSPKNGEPRVQPIVQSTTYTYDSAEEIGKLFDLQAAGYFYTRLANPTTNAAEEKITALEGGVATMCTASGQSAVFYAMLNILEAGDHFISSSYVYGGTYNLFAHTFKKMGIKVTFVDQDLSLEELKKAIRPNTKAVFAETIANPALRVLDIEKFTNSDIAIPETEEHKRFIERLTKEAVIVSINRHAGGYRTYFGGKSDTLAFGKDLTAVKWIVGTGGALTRLTAREEILNSISQFNRADKLLPTAEAKILIDNDYIMASLGILSSLNKEAAIKLLLKSLKFNENSV